MPKRGFAILLCAAFCVLALPASAQLNDRLTQQRFGAIALGEFQAGNNVRFTLTRYRGEFLLHFSGDPEVYVLYADYGPLGGRVLRYDSGAVALQVAGWGSMTVYPDKEPDGLAAVRNGDASSPSLPAVGQQQILSAADDEASHIAYVCGLRFAFTADWNATANDAGLRALVYDTLGNTARGIARFAASTEGRAAFSQRISTVRFQQSSRTLIQLTGKTLIVTYNPSQGYMGRASSRAIAFALGKLFKVPIQN
jgi:hypothetical protein